MKTAVIETKSSEAIANLRIASDNRANLLLLSSSLLTDRMFLHSNFLEVLNQAAGVKIWATSAGNPRFQNLWRKSKAIIEAFPEVGPFKWFPYNLLCELNNFVWDFRHQPLSRVSMWHDVGSKQKMIYIHTALLPARLLSLVR